MQGVTSMSRLDAARRTVGTGLIALALGAGTLAQQQERNQPSPAAISATADGQPQDAEFAKLVKEWTTSPEFMSPLVDHLPVAPGVPTPKDVLGYYSGTPKKLTHNADLLKYYRALEAKSPRVKVLSIGTSDENRELAIVFVGSEESIRQLDQERQALAQ